MRTKARALLGSAILLLLATGTWEAKSFGASQVAIMDSFAGQITYVPASFTAANHPYVVAGDWIVGTFSYEPVAQTKGSPGLYNYTGSANTSGYVPTFSFAIYTVTNNAGVITLQNQVLTDSFTGNTLGPADYYAVQLTYHAAGTSSTSGTTLNVKADSVAFQSSPFSTTGTAPINFTLYNPTNAFDTTPGAYTSSNLPLPDQTTLTGDFASSNGKSQGVFTYDPGGTSIITDITYTWNPYTQFQPQFMVPEPPGLVLGLLAIAICTAGFGVSRRRRQLAA
ncbi:MAG: hypothetical protein ACLQIB_49700 [Isosphaeraceae bacterium]